MGNFFAEMLECCCQSELTVSGHSGSQILSSNSSVGHESDKLITDNVLNLMEIEMKPHICIYSQVGERALALFGALFGEENARSPE